MCKVSAIKGWNNSTCIYVLCLYVICIRHGKLYVVSYSVSCQAAMLPNLAGIKAIRKEYYFTNILLCVSCREEIVHHSWWVSFLVDKYYKLTRDQNDGDVYFIFSTAFYLAFSKVWSYYNVTWNVFFFCSHVTLRPCCYPEMNWHMSEKSSQKIKWKLRVWNVKSKHR